LLTEVHRAASRPTAGARITAAAPKSWVISTHAACATSGPAVPSTSLMRTSISRPAIPPASLMSSTIEVTIFS
jgi:hypothetical protein